MSTSAQTSPIDPDQPVPTRGRNLGWNEDETIALAKAAAVVCADPAIGSSMSGTELGRRIRVAFVNSSSKPSSACTLIKSGCPLDSRRWDGRSAEGCRKYFDKIKSDCTRSKGCHDRVIKMDLTGNPSEDVLRCAELLFSDGGTASSHMYDCIRKKHYHIAKPFKFTEAYLFLSRTTNMLDAGGIGSKKVIDDDEKERPVGCKKAKGLVGKQKETKNKEAGSAADAIIKMEVTLNKALESKTKIAKEKLLVYRKRYGLEMPAKLLTPGSSIPADEKKKIERLLTKRLVASLEEYVVDEPDMKRVNRSELNFAEKAYKEDHPATMSDLNLVSDDRHNENEQNTADALVSLSTSND